ncbi:Protein unc-80 [Branchiostoma belcheri]|nr:Protein unc-80 [Branchiostoma belcheri]
MLLLQVLNPSQCALTTLVKAATVLVEDTFCDILPVAWELLLDSNQHVAKSAATLMLLSSVKIPEHVTELYVRELHHTDPTQRINAIKRWQILWNSRYHVWPSMEEGACFKIPPPNIDFTQPSPTIGLGGCTVADPPWMAHCTMWDENIAEDGQKRMFAAAATSRTAQQDAHLHQVLLAEEQHLQVARGECHITAVPVLLKAGYEQTLVQHDGDDDGKYRIRHGVFRIPRYQPDGRRENQSAGGPGDVEYQNVVSLNPKMQQRQFQRLNSVFEFSKAVDAVTTKRVQVVLWKPSSPGPYRKVRPGLARPDAAALRACEAAVGNVEERSDHTSLHQTLTPAQPVLPSAISAIAAILIRLTDDEEEELVWLLRRLLNAGDHLPQHTSHYLFNQLMGLVMYYVRSPVRGEDDAMAITLSAIYQVVPFVESLYPKDVKPILRKEHCEVNDLLAGAPPPSISRLNANVVLPEAKVIVHGTDESCIPTQLPVLEDTQFKSILQDCLEFFNIRQDQHDQHFLADKKTNQLRNDQWYVRDYYFFKRQVVPQLKLVKMDPRQAYQIYQKQTFTSKLADLGRLRFMTTLLQSSFPGQVLSHVMFLQSELKSLPSFSRKSLDVPFALFSGKLGKDLYDIDALHKNIWTKMLSGMFLNMPSEFPWDEDISLFLRTITGIFSLHCEDMNISRHCLAALINTAQRFKSVFTTHGYQPDRASDRSTAKGLREIRSAGGLGLKVYANNQHNVVLCEAIQIALQFLSKPLGGTNSHHFFPRKRATYHPDFVTPACVDHEISKPEVQLQYHNKPLGGPKSNHFQIALQFLSKPLGGTNSHHFFPRKRATYHPDFVTPACVDHEISKPEVQLQYHNKPLGGPKSNHFQIALQFLSKPLGGTNSHHFFPRKRATYHPDFVTPACVDHEISKPEVQLQYHNKPLGGPKSNHFQVSSRPTHLPNIKIIHLSFLKLCC